MGLAMAEQQGIDPRVIALMAPVCAGLAFVLPTSTPAMAMVFGTGYLRTRDTISGALISVLSIIGFLIIVYYLWSSLGLVVGSGT
jgi:sodium-dependent dicarboxylate transporter 2/3/5